MPKVIFHISKNKTLEAQFTPGERLLDVARRHDLPLEGTCDGAMACATCHVVIDSTWAKALPPASTDELAMLEVVMGLRRYSRLACQIRLTSEQDGMTLSLP